MSSTKQEPDLLSSKHRNVFNTVQKCFNNNRTLKAKILQFNSNVSSVIRDGCVEIDNICNRVRQHLTMMEEREKEIYRCNDWSKCEVCCHGDTEENESLNWDVRNTLPLEEVDVTTGTDLGYVSQTTDQNETNIDAEYVLYEVPEKIPDPEEIQQQTEEVPDPEEIKQQKEEILDPEEIQQQTEEKNTSPHSTATTDNLKGSPGQINTKEQRLNPTEETLKYNLRAEKLRNDEILRDVDESLRAISRVSVVTNCLEKYEVRYGQDKLKHVVKEVHETSNEKILVDTATKMSELGLSYLNTKEEKPKCLVDQATVYELPDAVDESQRMISEICSITNALLTNRSGKYKQGRGKLRLRKNPVRFAEPDSLKTDHNIDEIVDEIADHACVTNRPKQHKQDPQVSKSIQTTRMKETIQMMKKKLRQQKHVSGGNFEDINDTINTLSNNFDMVNKLVDSVNKDIMEFSKTAAYIVKDGVKSNFDLKKTRVKPGKWKRGVTRSAKSKRESQDHLIALKRVTRPITPIVIRKHATTDLRKKLRTEMGSRNTSILYKNVPYVRFKV